MKHTSVAQPDNPFAAELEAVRAALDDESLTPEGRMRGMLTRIRPMSVPPERAEVFRAELKMFAARVRELRTNTADSSNLCREGSALYRRVEALGAADSGADSNRGGPPVLAGSARKIQLGFNHFGFAC